MSDWKILLLILIIAGIGVLNLTNRCSSSSHNYDQQTQLDTISILNGDRELMIDLKESNHIRIRQFESAYKDSMTVKAALDIIKEVLDDKTNNAKSIQQQKNKEIFSFKNEYYQLKDKSINNWMIVFIILISGLLGGFARTKYPDLIDLLKSVEEAEEGIVTLENSINLEIVPQNTLTTLKGKLQKVHDTLKVVSDQEGEKVFVNIIFGIIASALSFLALTTFNSEILNFESDIDYFIFLGWCLLGAVFAKNWIMSLYNRIAGSDRRDDD